MWQDESIWWEGSEIVLWQKKKKNTKHVSSRRDAAARENERGQIRPSQVFASSLWKERTVSIGPATGDLKGGQN